MAAAGTATAAAESAFTVTKGMSILSPEGDRIGKVTRVVANSQGQVQQLLVKVDGAKVMLPASNFSVTGNALVSAMGEGQIKQLSEQQEAATGS